MWLNNDHTVLNEQGGSVCGRQKSIDKEHRSRDCGFLDKHFHSRYEERKRKED